jgi:hypothetical protein
MEHSMDNDGDPRHHQRGNNAKVCVLCVEYPQRNVDNATTL